MSAPLERDGVLPLHTLDTPAAARHLPIRFSQRCLDFCAGAPACAQWARQDGDPAVLGEGFRDALAPRSPSSCRRMPPSSGERR